MLRVALRHAQLASDLLSSGHGFLSHLLSGACPNPQALRPLEGATAKYQAGPLAKLRQSVSATARPELPRIARGAEAQELQTQCIACFVALDFGLYKA